MEPRDVVVFKMSAPAGGNGAFRQFDFFQRRGAVLREVDRWLALTARVARRLGEPGGFSSKCRGR